MHIILLTHQREQYKKTNTGQLVMSQSDLKVTRILWERGNPDVGLLKLISMGGVFLLYPEQSSTDPAGAEQTSDLLCDWTQLWQDCHDDACFIIIDSTWQEARKIYNRSPYLTDLPRVTLAPTEGSLFTLRRNQITGGLCTAESVIALLRMNQQNHLANKLETDFYTFVGHVPGNEKSS